MLANLLFTLGLLSTGAQGGSDVIIPNNANFEFYLGELVNCQMASDSPMVNLLISRLTDSVFEVSDAGLFYKQIENLRARVHEHPERMDRFVRLDRRLRDRFQERLESAKQTRLIYTAAGAVIGAVVGIPAGKMLAGSMGSKVLLISIPAGALVGGGAGFLLGELLAMPKYTYGPDTLNSDLEKIEEELSK